MKMSLTRLLNEIKLVNAKLEKKSVEDVKYFDIMSGGKLKFYKSEQDMKSVVSGHLNSIADLTKLRDKYKKLLLQANNTTTVTVNGVTLTISEAIAKKESIKQEQEHLKVIRRQLQMTEVNITNLDNVNESKLDEILKLIMGNKDKKTDGSEIESTTKQFRENNLVTLVDAGGAKKFLETKEDEIEKFISDIDFSLSEVNAKTEVEVG